MRSGAVLIAAAAVAMAAAGCGAAAKKPSHGPAFTQPTTLDNRWFPLRPGTSYVYAGTAKDDTGRVVKHRVVFYVTDVTKRIGGIETRVMWDRDFYGGHLKEDELTFWAQDDGGSVWNYGEYPEEVENGRVSGAPDSWIAGIRRARQGITMPARPRVGAPAYPQGFAPAIGFADSARAWKAGARTCVPAGCHRDVLVNEEWAPGEKGAHQLKYYAPNVGLVRVGYKGRVTDAERLVLVRVAHLDPRARARVKKAVLAMDRRAKRVSPKVYGLTAPAS